MDIKNYFIMEKPNVNNAEAVDKKNKAEQQGVKDVYIGVFFDGTNNNMVKKKNWNEKGDDNKETIRKRANDFFGEKVKEKEVKEYYNANNDVRTRHDDKFSNIAILYNHYKLNERTNQRALFYHFYVEGSGAVEFKVPTSDIMGNPNGLGFGLGHTGVVALVSKAVKYIYRFIIGHKSQISEEDTHIHFQIFGFSRGSTCARLLTQIITRENMDNLGIRETEFSRYYAKDLYTNLDSSTIIEHLKTEMSNCENDSEKKQVNNLINELESLEDKGKTCYDELIKKHKEFGSILKPRLNFLNKYKKKTVDFLGIYDTVVSIGFLKKDFQLIHPLRALYRIHPHNDYKANYHYLNVKEYGMNISEDNSKVRNICHICAMDEYRENFALTNIGCDVPTNGIELLIPGCHSDVGGGYFDGDNPQKEMILNKRYITQQGKDLDTRLQFESPFETPTEVNTIAMNSESLDKLGWIDKEKTKAIMLDGDNEKKLCTITYTDDNPLGVDFVGHTKHLSRTGSRIWSGDYDKENTYKKGGHVKIKRNVKAGYSNIPLFMMIKCVSLCNADLEIDDYLNVKTPQSINIDNFAYPASPLFSTDGIIEISGYKIPNDLKILAENMIKQVEKPNSNRKWLYPLYTNDSGTYNSNAYHDLRLKYLHFTSTSYLFHTNSPWKKDREGAKIIDGTPGNLGNTPNFDENGTLCRIIYDGNKVDENVTITAKSGVKFMYDMKLNEKIGLNSSIICFAS